MSENILETVNLFYDYSGLQVLTGVDLQVRRGERHAIIGPNGAGKTTLFNVITGMYAPSRGKVLFNGKNVSGFKPYKLSRLGMGRSFQITSTFHNLSTFQNIRMGVLSRMGVRFNMFNRVDKMEAVARETNAILERINLKEVTHVPADALSYGKHRSLEVSLAMSTDPDLVMLDEPTAGMSRDETHSAVGPHPQAHRRQDHGHCGARHGRGFLPGRPYYRAASRQGPGRGQAGRNPEYERGQGRLSGPQEGGVACFWKLRI